MVEKVFQKRENRRKVSKVLPNCGTVVDRETSEKLCQNRRQARELVKIREKERHREWERKREIEKERETYRIISMEIALQEKDSIISKDTIK